LKCSQAQFFFRDSHFNAFSVYGLI
jgi:hypothetical protein